MDEFQGGRVFTSANRRMDLDDEITLTSVGIDIGSSTSHLAISRLTLERVESRYVVAKREMLFESEILLTPYTADGAIDAARLGAFIAGEYRRAGLEPAAIDTGALILTGVAVRRHNARAIGELFAAEAGKPLSNGNKAHKAAHYVSSADTTLVSRYKAAGLISLGRTNSPELGSVPVTEPEAWGPTRNPWDTSRTSGGSSGGSASAVAAGMVPIAHASDGGGSIRIPSACCGLVGLKVSQGRISMGPARDESNLGVEHCVSRTVRDTAILMRSMAGHDAKDTTSVDRPVPDYEAAVGKSVKGLRIGIPKEYRVPGMPAEVHLSTGDRTMLSYLVKPLQDQLSRAFRER